MKKICIAAIGTRGDIYPAVELAKILEKENNITIITSPDNIELMKRHGFDSHAIGKDFSEVVCSGKISDYRQQIELQFTEHIEIFSESDIIIGAGVFGNSELHKTAIKNTIASNDFYLVNAYCFL